MIAECARHNVRLFVVKQNRFNVPVVKLREALDPTQLNGSPICLPPDSMLLADLAPWRRCLKRSAAAGVA